ncbi:hypothetical protein BDV30DRAFT_202127 [Aspergillus minisclerotigenes]|uniref:Uncharacterized protein n=1 Tax=Aspergillus minisclerotigenes TaxID=656917 RepID=A0A5N6JPA2_9EURO|nr:hypothetical protein BDV30DRAFT_202127 [Aspergillus minisclerotigenes]
MDRLNGMECTYWLIVEHHVEGMSGWKRSPSRLKSICRCANSQRSASPTRSIIHLFEFKHSQWQLKGSTGWKHVPKRLNTKRTMCFD